MKKNMGSIDRIIRISLAVIVALLYFTGQITGIATIVLGIVAVIFLTTGLLGSCPLYSIVNLSTKKE